VAGLPKDEVRRYVRELRLFYKEVLVAAVIFVFCLVAWMATGGSFWPVWVFFAFSVKIAIRAVAVGVVNKKACLTKFTSFLSQEWEEKQVDKYIKSYEAKRFRDDAEEDEEDEHSVDITGATTSAATRARGRPKKAKRNPGPGPKQGPKQEEAKQGAERSTREGA
jgi:hypothetical protein